MRELNQIKTPRVRPAHRANGFTLVEMLLAVAIATIIITTVGGLLGQSLQAHDFVRNKNALYQEARFAMQRMTDAVSGTRRLLIPLAENPVTAWSESVREFPPRAAFPNETAVLAVTLDPALDRDEDGWADANNDKDFLDINGNTVPDAGEERTDEDWPNDANNDNSAGIDGIDDDNDGSVDEGSPNDDDEDGASTEDPVDGIDNDGDGSIDEDADDDMNQDGFAGTGGTGDNKDDDEDGIVDEDWLDTVVYYQSSNNALCTSKSCLIERLPNLNPVDGRDFSERPIAENVSLFRMERMVRGNRRTDLVEITLELTDDAGESVRFTTQVRAGGPS